MIVVLARQAFRDTRIRTVAFVYLFAVYSFIQPVGYRHTYATVENRLAFARSFGDNVGLRLLYGQPHDVSSVAGYSTWRVGGVLAIAAAAFGLLAAVRALRGEEESGRLELVLAAVVSRRSARLGWMTAIAAGILLLWLAEFLGFILGGLPAAGSAYLALATASVAPVFVGVGAFASQLAATRRSALGLGGAVLGLMLLARMLADTVAGSGWLRWATPLGWAEQSRPFAGAQPLVLVLPVLTTALLLTVSGRLAERRDIGTGALPVLRERAEPQLRMLGSPTALALRTQRGVLLAWLGAVATFMFILGVVSDSISPADVPQNVQGQIARFGAGSIVTPSGYLGFLFLFVVVALSVYGVAQIADARREEGSQRLETLLAQPVGRAWWLIGRLSSAVVGIVLVSLTAGVFAWAGARAAGVDIALPRMLEAGANAVPTAVLFLGIAALAFGVAPRASSGIAYGLVTLAFFWHLVGSLLAIPGWLLDLTPFAHIGLVPAEPFHAVAAIVMSGIGLLAGLTAVAALRHRDLITD